MQEPRNAPDSIGARRSAATIVRSTPWRRDVSRADSPEKLVDEKPEAGWLAYWGPPIVAGLVIGTLLVGAWRFLGIGRTAVDEIAAEWKWGEFEANDKLRQQVVGLGREAREDLLATYLAAPCDYADYKLWLGTILATEPFFDTSSLVEAVRTGDACDQRTSAVILAEILQDADPELVLPGILAWLEDVEDDQHDAPIRALGTMSPLIGAWHGRARAALLELATRRGSDPEPLEDNFRAEDRAAAVNALGDFLPDDGVLALLTTVMTDDDDHPSPRIVAIRQMSQNGAFDDLETWKTACESATWQVRQTAAENLVRSPDPAFSSVLEKLHTDAESVVRIGAIETETHRRRPTMLPVAGQLLEDHDEWVRFYAMLAVAAFGEEPGAALRNGMLLRVFRDSDDEIDVEGAVLALTRVLGKTPPGFREIDVHRHKEEVDAAAIKGFMGDAGGRTEAAAEVQKMLGADAVYPVAERKKALQTMLEHADLENQARAKLLLEELGD